MLFRVITWTFFAVAFTVAVARWVTPSGRVSKTASSDSAAVFASTSALKPVSVGLGFRVIPALGGGAQQFQP